MAPELPIGSRKLWLPSRKNWRLQVSTSWWWRGGETSGAVVRALGVQALSIGPEIAPGVPWTQALPQGNMALALKSGNFGGPEFFLKAFEVLALDS